MDDSGLQGFHKWGGPGSGWRHSWRHAFAEVGQAPSRLSLEVAIHHCAMHAFSIADPPSGRAPLATRVARGRGARSLGRGHAARSASAEALVAFWVKRRRQQRLGSRETSLFCTGKKVSMPSGFLKCAQTAGGCILERGSSVSV